jgi:hypothetical protein
MPARKQKRQKGRGPNIPFKRIVPQLPNFLKFHLILIFIVFILIEYIHCRVGIHCNNSEFFTLIMLPSPFPCLNPLPTVSPKTITKGFIFLFHVCLQSTSTAFTHLHLLHSPYSFPQIALNTVPILQSCLPFLIQSQPSKVFEE